MQAASVVKNRSSWAWHCEWRNHEHSNVQRPSLISLLVLSDMALPADVLLWPGAADYVLKCHIVLLLQMFVIDGDQSSTGRGTGSGLKDLP